MKNFFKKLLAFFSRKKKVQEVEQTSEGIEVKPVTSYPSPTGRVTRPEPRMQRVKPSSTRSTGSQSSFSSDYGTTKRTETTRNDSDEFMTNYLLLSTLQNNHNHSTEPSRSESVSSYTAPSVSSDDDSCSRSSSSSSSYSYSSDSSSSYSSCSSSSDSSYSSSSDSSYSSSDY